MTPSSWYHVPSWSPWCAYQHLKSLSR